MVLNAFSLTIVALNSLVTHLTFCFAYSSELYHVIYECFFVHDL